MRSISPSSGALSYTIDDANDTLDRRESLDVTDEATSERCKPWLIATVTPQVGREDGYLSFNLSFDCYYEPGLRLIVRARGLTDPRQWQEGEFEVELEEGAVEVTHIYGGRGRGPFTSCTTHIDNAALGITVEEARGGRRPYPELVDPSFLRRFSLALDLPSHRGEPAANGSRPCPSVGVSLRLDYLLDTESFSCESGHPCR